MKKTAAPAKSYDLEQKNPLTPEEINQLLDIIYDKLSNDGAEEPAAAFLLLLNVLTFEEDGRERFGIWIEARSKFALEFSGPYKALETSLAGALAGMRKGDAR